MATLVFCRLSDTKTDMSRNTKDDMALSESAGAAGASVMRPESEPSAEDKSVEEIDSLATSLPEQMRQLKARYREERRKLETRTFDPPEGD